MSGVYYAPRTNPKEALLKAIENLASSGTGSSPEILQAFQYFFDRERLINFPELSYEWQYTTLYKFPQVSTYLTREGKLVYSVPKKVEIEWELIGENGFLISFAKVPCAGFVVLT